MSILRFLLLMLLSIITLVSFTAALTGYSSSVSQAEKLFDQNLADFARSLHIVVTDKHIVEPVPMRGLAFQIWHGGQLVAKSDNAPDHSIAFDVLGYSETNFGGQRWRTYSWQGSDKAHLIVVAQPLSERVDLAESLALESLSPLVVATPLLAILIALTIRRGLSPLEKLSASLRSRRANDFTPVKLNRSPAELRPVVDTLNRLLRKVETAFEREKRFSADAAHELRTPISVLQVGIHNLSELHPELRAELNNLQSGVERMSHVVEQILQLNRTHPDHFKATFQRLLLSELCQKSIAHCYDEIDNKGQTIELEAEPLAVAGDNFALATMLDNLILNASKYTPQGGSIVVAVERAPQGVKLRIEDSGPGIKEQDYERVLDRFYRSGGDQHASEVAGCGLGMAIVKQVVDLHGADISLGRSTALGGLLVTVRFPRCEVEA